VRGSRHRGGGAVLRHCDRHLHAPRHERDTTNQFADPAAGVHAGMLALIVAEIGGFTVLLAGFVVGQLL
jgi:hypothetical protein